MSEAHVRRGGGGRAKPRKAASKVAVPKKIVKRLPVDQGRANRIAGLTLGGFLLAIGAVVLVALDIPAKAERSAGAAVGRAGFTVGGYQIVGINHMDRNIVDRVVNAELQRAADEAGSAKAPQPLVDVGAIRRQLLQFGWVKDARVQRRLPDTLVIDVVGFNDVSWLGWPGWFHSNNMRVEERLTREGNTLLYQATVHDPDVLVEPWQMDPRRLPLNTSDAPYLEDPPCLDFDLSHMLTRERG